MSKTRNAVIGIAEHNSWAHFVSVGLDGEAPRVLDRRTCTLVVDGLPTQPYHHETLKMDMAAADALVARVRESAREHAAAALDAIVAALPSGYGVRAIATRQPPLERLPDTVAEVHASWNVTCRADGMIYHEALCGAARDRGYEIVRVKRGTELDVASRGLRCTPEALAAVLDDLRRTLGPPWRKDQKFAVAAAIAALTKAVGEQ